MTTIREEIEKLEDKHLNYVIERSRVLKDVDGYNNANISKTTFYSWPSEVRDHLNGLAQRMKREAALKANMILEEAVEDAARLLVAQTKGEGGKRVSASVQQRAAVEVLDRVAGKPTQKQEISGPDGGAIQLEKLSDEELEQLADIAKRLDGD